MIFAYTHPPKNNA